LVSFLLSCFSIHSKKQIRIENEKLIAYLNCYHHHQLLMQSWLLEERMNDYVSLCFFCLQILLVVDVENSTLTAGVTTMGGLPSSWALIAKR
jgi:hypothetical protein